METKKIEKKRTAHIQVIDNFEDNCIAGEFIRIRDYHKKDSRPVIKRYPIIVED